MYILAPHSGALAATLTWDGGGGHPSDATGTWTTGTTNWWNGSSSTWTDGSIAQFGVGTGGTTAYTVTLNGIIPMVGGITFANNNYTLASGTISLGSSGTTGIAVNTGSATITSILSGSAALGYSGTGTLTLGGSNTYSGGTVISGGVLRLGNASATGASASPITVASGATLDINGLNAAGNPMITISGTGTAGQGAVFTSIGSPGVKLTLAADASYGGSNRLDLNAGLVGNNHVLTKIGTGLSDLWGNLNGNNSLSALNVQQGTVYFEASTTTTTTFNVSSGATLGFYSGGTLASPRTLNAPVVVASGGILGSAGGGGASLYDAYAGPVTLNGAATVNPGTANYLFTGSVSGTGAIATSNGAVILSGSNSYSGGSTVSSGTLEFSTPNSMSSSGVVTGGSGAVVAVAVGGAGQFTTGTSGAGTIGGMLSGIGGQGGTVTWVSGLLLGIDTTAASGTYAGVISNLGGTPIAINKFGANTLTLTASNTYTGATTVTGGTLALAAGAFIGGTANSITVNNGSQLSMAGGSTLTASALSVTGSAQLSIASGAVLTTSTASAISVTGSGAIYLENGGLINTPSGAIVTLMSAGSTTGMLTSSGTGIGGTLDLHGSSLYLTPNNTTGAVFTLNNVVVQNVNDFELARGGGTRTLTLQNGTQLTAKSMTVSVDAGSGDIFNVNSGSILNLSGGTLSMHGGSGNADTVNINGGTVTNVGQVTFAGATRGWESIVISNSGQLSSSANSDINCVSGTTTVTGTGSYWNMNGATLTIGAAIISGTYTSQGNVLLSCSGGQVSTGGLILGSASNSVILDNGRLTAGAAGNLISGSGYAYIRSGGAILDSGGFNTTVSVPIVTDTTSIGGGLTKNGAGTLTLTGTNTYTGATTINAGTLESAKVAASNSTSAITVNNAGTLAVNFGGASDYAASDVVTLLGKTTFGATTAAFGFDTTNLSGTYGNNLTMAAGLTKLGSNTLTLTGTNTYTGATTISAGTLQIGDGSLPVSSIITDNAALVYNLLNSGTCANVINGTGTLAKIDANTLILSGSNSYTGTTTVSSGTLILGNANAVQGSIVTNSIANGLVFNSGIGSFNFGGLSGSVNLALTDAGGAPVALNVGGNPGNTTYSGVLSGSGSLTQYGTGTLTLTSSSTYTGATTVSNGSLTVSGAAGSLAATSGVTVTGATFNVGDTTNGPAGSINSAAGLTLGGSNGGGYVLVNRSGTLLQANVASVTVGAGYSYVAANGFSSTVGALNITGAGTNFTRLPGGIYNSSGGGGQKSTAFVNTPTGSVIGSGANAMLIGAVVTGGGYGFVSATTGALAGLATTNDTYASGVNTTLTVDTTLATGTTQSLFFTSNVAKTLKLNGTLTVESGGIILGQGLTGVGIISGTGSLKAPAGQDLWIGVNQNAGACNLSTISASIVDDGASTGLTKFGSGTLLLSGSNTFGGPIYLDTGVLAVGNANALGQGTASINFLGSAGYGANVTLQASGVDFTSARNLVIGGGITGAVIDTNGQNVILSGLISNGGTPSTNSAGALVKMSLGTLTLNGSAVNTYNGSTAVNGGTLKLDFANLATPTNLLSNSTSLILGGGSLSLLGKSTGTTSQTLTNLTLTANTGSGIVLNPNGGSGTTLTFSGSVTRNAGATLNVDLSAGGTLATNLAAGTLGYATVKDATGTGFAKATGSALQRQTALTTLVSVSSASATDFITSPTGSSATGSPYRKMVASFSANTLTIDTTNATGANFLDLGGASDVLTLTQKGLLILGANDFTIQNGQVGAAATETILHTMGTGTFTISGLVGSGAGYLTKNGAGTLVLGGANTYTGATAINAGLVKAGVDSVSTTSGALGTSSGGTVTVNLGAALDFNGHVVNKNLNLNGSGISGGGALTNSSSTAGSLIKNGAGNLILPGSNTFTGGATLNSGTLGLTSAASLGSTSNIFAINGGTVDVATNAAVTTTVGTLLLNNAFATTSSGGTSGSWVVAAPVTLGKTVAITANAAGGTTFSSVISDGGNGYGLTKSGSGLLVLTAANTYTGLTTVNGGTLAFGIASVVPSANSIAINNGGTLMMISKDTWGGWSTTTGPAITVNSGGILSSSNSFNTLWNLTLNGGTVRTNGGTNSPAQAFQFCGTLTATGTSAMVVGSTANGLNAINISGQGNSTLTVNTPAPSDLLTINNSLQDGMSVTSSLLKSGSGTLVLNGSNTYTGTTTVSGGTLQIGNGSTGSISASGAVTVTSGGTLALNLANSGTISNQINISGGVVNMIGSGTNTLSGYVGGFVSGVMNQNGTGTTVLTGNNYFYGTTNLNVGLLQPGSQNAAYGSTVNVGVDNSLLFGVNAVTIGALSGSGAVVLANGTNAFTLTAGANNASTTYSGILSGSGSFVKTGAGTLTVTASSAYTGSTTINGGTLALSPGLSFGGTSSGIISVAGGALSIPSGATLTVSGGGISVSANGAIYLENGGTMNVYSSSPASMNAYINGNTAWYTSGRLTSSGTGMGGILDLHNAAFYVCNINSGNYQFTFDNVTVQNVNEFELDRGGSGHVVTLQNGAQLFAKSMTVAVDSSNDTLNVNSNSVINLGGGSLLMHGGGGGNSVVNINGGTVTNVGTVDFAVGSPSRSANSLVISNGGLLSSTVNGNINCVSGSATVTGNGSSWNMHGTTLTIGQAVTTGTNTGQGNSLTVANGGLVTTGGLVLGSTNNWVTLDGGTVAAGANGNLISGSGYVYVRAGGAILDSGTFTTTVSTPIVEDASSTGGGMNVRGTGILTLTGSNSYTGGTTVNSGVLQITSDAQLGMVPASPSTNITFNGGQLYNNNSAPSLAANRNILLTGNGGFIESGWGQLFTINGEISGSAGLGIVWDGGAVLLAGSNNYTGATAIGANGAHYFNNVAASALLWLGNNNALPGGDLIFGNNANGNKAMLDLRGFNATVGALSGGTNAVVDNLWGGGVYTLTAGNGDASSTFTGTIKNISGAIALVKTGTGTLLLNGANGYTGATTVNAGTLQIGDGTTGSLAAGSAVTVNSGAALALDLANSGTFGNQITNAGGVVNFIAGGTNTLSGVLGGAVSGVMNQSGSGTTIITGNNQFYGTTNISVGVLELGSQNAVAESTVNVGINNGLAFGVNAVTVGGLAGTGNIVLANGTNAVALTVGQNNASTSYSGSLSGAGSLTKTGSGTLTLAGSNAYTGNTTVNAGTLALGTGTFGGTVGGVVTVAGGALSIPSGAVVSASANLTVSGSGAVYLENGGRIDTVGNVTAGASGVSLMKVWNTSGQLTSSGTGTGGILDLHNSNLFVIATNVGNDRFTFDNVNVQNANDFEIARGASGRTVTLQNGATLNARTLTVSVDASGDTLNINSGASVNLNGGNLIMHQGSGGSDVLNINGGTVTNAGAIDFTFGGPNRPGNALVISNGGQLSSLQNSSINCVSGTVAVTGNGSSWNMNGKTLSIGAAQISGTNTSQGNSLVIANGGRVTTAGVVLGSTNNWVSIDGGILAAGASGNLISGSGYAYVRASGAVIDTGTFNATVQTPFVEDPASTGGGLTKTGAGTLTLTAVSTYSGNTTANGGTLKLANSLAIQNSTLSVGAGAVVFDSSVGTHAFVAGALSGSGSLVLQDNAATPNPVALTVGGNNESTTFSGALSGSGSLTKSGAGILTFSGPVNIGGLTVDSGIVELGQSGTIGAVAVNTAGTLALAANNVNSAKVLDTSSLSIAGGGALDLWDNALILRDPSGGLNQGTNLSMVQGLVNAAADNGNWDKPGITSSTVIADLNAYSVLTIMVYDNTVLGVNSFEGINNLQSDNGGNQVMLKMTYIGDFDGNGIVNSADYGWLDFYYGYGLTVGDLNGDGQVNSADYNGIDYGYGYQAYGVLASGAATPPASAASAPAAPEAVPEPGTLGLLLAGALGLFGFRRKNALRS